MPDLLDRLNAAMAGRYAVDAAVGRGGMATVFRARDLKHGRPVAIKVLHPDLADSVGHERFLREIEILAGLNHPNILGLIDSGEADGLLYYVMPFVDGESLRDRLQREGQLPIEDAVGITREVADALGFAHRQGFVHRDVKPGNIMFLAGHAVVTDFGIARAVSEAGGDQLTRTGLSIGTPHYMSPEQATGAETLDGRSDLYSLGCVLYEMVGGEPPYSGSTSAAILARHSQAEIPSVEIIRPQTPPQVTQVIERALAKSPADRYRTAQQLREELSGDVAVSARKAAKRTDRSWGRAALISASVLVLAAAAWAASQARSRSAPGSPLPLLRSVAVLSFADLTPGGDLAHLGEGIAEELRYVLAGLPDLKVAGRTSSIRLSHRDLGYAELGDQLGVDAIIDGTVRRDEDRIRVKLEALRASDGSPLWSEAFEGDLAGEGVFDLQEQIAEMAVKALLPELKGVSIPTSRNRTSDSEVYDHYIRGEHLMYMLTRM